MLRTRKALHVSNISDCNATPALLICLVRRRSSQIDVRLRVDGYQVLFEAGLNDIRRVADNKHLGFAVFHLNHLLSLSICRPMQDRAPKPHETL